MAEKLKKIHRETERVYGEVKRVEKGGGGGGGGADRDRQANREAANYYII